MTVAISQEKAPFATRTSKSEKRAAGRTLASATPLEVRAGGHRLDTALRKHMRDRMGQKLGKFAPMIERASVRFEDVNGPRGGLDKSCVVQIVLSSLKPVVAQERAGELAEAFDLALAKAERATRRSLQKHGFSARAPNGHAAANDGEANGVLDQDTAPDRTSPAQDEGSLIGRRVGQSRKNLLEAAARPEKTNRAAFVDTALPGTSASDRRVGHGHTARRNTKLNDAGMAYALEDSMQERPSRKSTRKSANGKSDSNLSARAKRRSLTPAARHAR